MSIILVSRRIFTEILSQSRKNSSFPKNSENLGFIVILTAGDCTRVQSPADRQRFNAAKVEFYSGFLSKSRVSS